MQGQIQIKTSEGGGWRRVREKEEERERERTNADQGGRRRRPTLFQAVRQYRRRKSCPTGQTSSTPLFQEQPSALPQPACRMRQHTSAYVSICVHTSAYVCIRLHTSAYVSKDVAIPGTALSIASTLIRQLTSAHVSIRQHMSAYVSGTLLCQTQT